MPSAALSKIVIECMLSKDDNGLVGEGCIYDRSSSSPTTVSRPEGLQPGDYVKLRLWLPEDSGCITIELAEVQWVRNHWINVDVLIASAENKVRLEQFAGVEDISSPFSRRKSERIMIHA